jgi:hypothetical protein
MSTTRETAERIASEYAPTHTLRNLLTVAIDKALQAEREQAATIVNNALRRLDTLNACCAEPMRAVLVAIREGKPQE